METAQACRLSAGKEKMQRTQACCMCKRETRDGCSWEHETVEQKRLT